MSNSIFERYELKYLVNSRQRVALERAFLGKLAVDAYGESSICNIYYDTEDFRLIRRSLEKPVYKEKLRVRSYGTVSGNGNVFLELKKKYDGIVYKRRIELPEQTAMQYLADKGPLPADSQIGREMDYFKQFYKNLEPKVHLCYDRVALYSLEGTEVRVTFDRNITYRTDRLSLREEPGGTQILEKGQSLMELKVPAAIPMWLVEVLEKENIRQVSFSKYGRAYENIVMEREKERKEESRGIYCA